MEIAKISYIKSKNNFYIASLTGKEVTKEEFDKCIKIIKEMLPEKSQKCMEIGCGLYTLEDLNQYNLEIEGRIIPYERFRRPERDFYMVPKMNAFLIAASYILQSELTISRRDIEIFTEFIKIYYPNVDVLIDYYTIGYKKGDVECLKKLFWIYRQKRDYYENGSLKQLLKYGEEILQISMIKNESLINLDFERELFEYAKELYKYDSDQYLKVYNLVRQIRELSSNDKIGGYYDYLNLELEIYSKHKLPGVMYDLGQLYIDESHIEFSYYVTSNNLYYIAKAYASDVNREPDYDKAVELLQLCCDISPSSIYKCGPLLAYIALNQNNIPLAEYYLQKCNILHKHICFYAESKYLAFDPDHDSDYLLMENTMNKVRFLKKVYGNSLVIKNIDKLDKALFNNVAEKEYLDILNNRYNRNLLAKLRHPTIRNYILGAQI